MSRHTHSIVAALFAIAPLCWQSTAAASPPRSRLVPLFDGKGLDGWEGNRKLWKVREKMILGDSPGIKHNEFLCTRKAFGDFELRLEFRLVGGKGNSGIQFRSRRVPGSTEVSGYQADIGASYWGCLYDESRRNRVLARPAAEELAQVLKKDGWNSYVIRAVGSHITLELNGLRTVDYRERDEGIARRGVIALQVHSGGPMQVQFRNLLIRELD